VMAPVLESRFRPVGRLPAVIAKVLAPVPPLSLGDAEFSSIASCEPVAYQLSFPTANPRNYRLENDPPTR